MKRAFKRGMVSPATANLISAVALHVWGAPLRAQGIACLTANFSKGRSVVAVDGMLQAESAIAKEFSMGVPDMRHGSRAVR